MYKIQKKAVDFLVIYVNYRVITVMRSNYLLPWKVDSLDNWSNWTISNG